MSCRQLRSSTRSNPDTNNQYRCPCKGECEHRERVACASCGALSCKPCIIKRFDISSQQRYNNIVKKNFECYECTHTEKRSEAALDEDERYFRSKFVYMLRNNMGVYAYSMVKMQDTQSKYAEEIKQRLDASSHIAPSAIGDHVNEKHIISLSSDLLKLIFVFCSTKTDKTVLTLLRVCKRWREVIHLNWTDHKFQIPLWMGVLNNLLPDEILTLVRRIPAMQTQTRDEYTICRQILDSSYEPDSSGFEADTNIPLLIQILEKCHLINEIELWGALCEDVFLAISMHCKRLRSWNFRYSHADNDWLRWLFGESVVRETL